MATFYRLAEHYLLRGWDKLPYALVDSRTGGVGFLSRAMMDVLLKCDGTWDFDSPLTADQDREFAAMFLSKGRIEQCAPGTGLLSDQRYRFYPNRFVLTVHWSITGKCNYRCRHCFMSAPQGRYGELSHESVMDIARQIAACGIPQVSLSGGEPLVRPDFLDIAAELSRHGVVITQLHTNGSLLNADVLDGLEALGQKPEIIISFDGVGFHDWMRGKSGAQASADAAFELCAKKGFRARATMCAYHENLKTLRETVNHLASVDCKSVSVGRVNESGEWLHNGASLTPTYEEYLEAALNYIPQYYEDGMPLPLTISGVFAASPEEPHRYTIAPYKPGSGGDEKLLFSCARSLLQIYPDGRPAICDILGPDFVGMPPIVSNESGQRSSCLTDVLTTGSAYMNLMDVRCSSFKERNAECRRCSYLHVCGGGCRASAYQANGSIFSQDPAACIFFRNGWAQRVVDVVRDACPEAKAQPIDDLPIKATERRPKVP